MPRKINWTAAQDALIRRLRAQGTTWDRIAVALNVTRWTVIDRGRRIGAQLPQLVVETPAEDPERPPLPPGDPRSWGAITAGTALEGMPYPIPVAPR